MNYIEELKKLVCSQVDEFIIDVMRPEKDADYQTRRDELASVIPTYGTQDDGSTMLVKQYDSNGKLVSDINNNPKFTMNMIEMMNTPFDHIDRILLQDFSSAHVNDDEKLDIDKYIYGLFNNSENDKRIKFSSDECYATDIGLCDSTQSLIDYSPVNGSSMFNDNKFIIDSFTYTPFIDYSTANSMIGVYSDEYLNKYNSGWFDDSKNMFADANRRDLTSNLYELRNLDEDVYNAKIAFRTAINLQDKKTYIYTLCEHLMTLFAKLSNIRMSHIIYGFKTPHAQWEGMLALDIWYQMLYRELDGKYLNSDMFNEDYLNVNPMSKLEVHESESGKYVIYNGNVVYRGQEIDDTNGMHYACLGSNTLTWMCDGVDDNHALIWDSAIYQAYNEHSSNINERRSEYVIPSKVLSKIYSLVYSNIDGDQIYDSSSGDFKWFYQKGKVYSDSTKSLFTRYTNLHLGAAYQVMSAKEYHDLCGYTDVNDPFAEKVDGIVTKYVKPHRSVHTQEQNLSFYRLMISHGVATIKDVFSVLRDECVFNIFNSNTNRVELFVPENAKFYSQAQCAIVIERIFSRLYKYLSFKSTTGEKFARHVNIDNGYKYLTTNSLLGNQNSKNAGVYYDDRDTASEEPTYLSYLNKVKTYVDSRRDVDFTSSELAILKNAINLLSSKQYSWKNTSWNLCPFCVSKTLLSRTGKMSRAIEDSSEEYDRVVDVVVNLGISGGMNIDFNGNSHIPSDVVYNEHSSQLTTQISYGSTFDLSQIVLSPTYEYTSSSQKEAVTLTYELKGYSTNYGSSEITYLPNAKIEVNSDEPIVLYAVWKKQYLLVFNGGYSKNITGRMTPIIVNEGETCELPLCSFEYENNKIPQFKYFEDELWVNESSTSSENYDLYKFSYWNYQLLGKTCSVLDGGKIVVPVDGNITYPIIVLTANWNRQYYVVEYKVSGKTYCQTLVDIDTNTLPKIEPPMMRDSNSKFIGWDTIIGSTLTGIDESDQIVCHKTDVDGDVIVCDPGIANDVIICEDLSTDVYGKCINAIVADIKQISFTLSFKYVLPSGEIYESVHSIVENTQVPLFHLHDTVMKDGRKLVFRYWKVESGNVSSSLTILSDTVLSAVYDEIEDEKYEPYEVDQSEIVILTPIEQVAPVESGCQYVSSNVNKDGEYYCTFSGFTPIDSDNHNRVHADCPLVNALNREHHVDNDFDIVTLIEVSDISNLVKALFKINIDIAHREYYLKVEVQDDVDWWYGYKDGTKWVSFEPTVEYKFSNLHALNQIQDGKLICSVDDKKEQNLSIQPINRELLDENGVQYNDVLYYYDYINSLKSINLTVKTDGESKLNDVKFNIDDHQNYYAIRRLALYENSPIQSPVDVNGFVKHRLSPIERQSYQVQTYTSIVKKYRPIIVPSVKDIFNDFNNGDFKTKYQVDVDNSYGVFGWCSIPSKTMVNMEYNEKSIIVPSSYDHHNRVGGNNFLQMDSDLHGIYRTSDDGVRVQSTIKESWYYKYNTRDWTYFIKPFFNMQQNVEIWSEMNDMFPDAEIPRTSNHINGVVFENSIVGRQNDSTFGAVVDTCSFLARYHHSKMNLELLSEEYTNLIPYTKLRSMTMVDPESEDSEFNSLYGSKYNVPESYRYSPDQWVDDFNKTGAYIGDETYDNVYKYNLGQSHAIDDFDEDSVWMYITMTPPQPEQEQVVEVEDIMPFVFWWSNRGVDNNGPAVDCYGLQSNAKINYEQGGYCYESSFPGSTWDSGNPEQRWHAVHHTLGVDFSKQEYGGTVVTQDNSGNNYKGAFDPHCTGTDEKWKVHYDNAFGTPQHDDPIEDKYFNATETHGSATRPTLIDEQRNDEETLVQSIQNKPMTWNLWNIVRHYCYIKYFKNKNKVLGDNTQAWDELETMTKRLMKSIYRTFKGNQYANSQSHSNRHTFSDVDQTITNYGNRCLLKWCNSFIEISSMFERNAREHDASFVLFTGNDSEFYGNNTQKYSWIRQHEDNFIVSTLNGPDDDETGMRFRISDANGGWKSTDSEVPKSKVYQGSQYSDLPTSYCVGDSLTYASSLPDVVKTYSPALNLSEEYPEAEYYLNDTNRQWVHQIHRSFINKQIIPIYTSMETMTPSFHKVTVAELKSITFSVIPQFYWKYEWSFNKFMIHRVGKLDAPCSDIPMYDMLGNVWEWVRDDWSEHISSLNGKTNPIVGGTTDSKAKKVIKGGAFDQLARKVISPSREGIEPDKNKSQFGTQANIGFRPSLTFTSEGEGDGFDDGSKIDLFFLFDASGSQDSEIQTMVEQSHKIIAKFASTSDSDKCHVGSALFMGPQIHIMMGDKVGGKVVQDAWSYAEYTIRHGTDIKSNSGKHYHEYYKRIYNESGKSSNEVEYNELKAEYVDSGNYPTTRAKARNELNKTLKKAISDHFEQVSSTRSAIMSSEDDSDDFIQLLNDDEDYGIELLSDEMLLDFPTLMSARDTSGVTGGGGDGGGDGGKVPDPAYIYFRTYHIVGNVHVDGHAWVGSPVTKKETSDGWEFNFSNGKGKNDDFYTYNPSEDTKYRYPFTYRNDGRGTLSNWYAGCECVYDMLAKLVSGDSVIFESPIRHDTIAYGFRPGVPRLIFVFSNEYDNEFVRTYSYEEGSKQSCVYLYPGASGGQLELNGIEFKQKTKMDVSEHVNSEPVDPYCLQTLRENWNDVSKYTDFLNKINLRTDSFDGELEKISELYSCLDYSQYNPSTEICSIPQTFIEISNNNGFSTSDSYKANLGSGVKWQSIYNVNYTLFKSCIFAYYDDSQRGSAFKNEPLWGAFSLNQSASILLPYEWQENIKKTIIDTSSPTVSPGFLDGQMTFGATFNISSKSYGNYKIKSVTPKMLKTGGYYRLRKALHDSKNQRINIYMMVTNANAPEPIDDFTEEDTLVDKFKKMCWFQDQLLFADLHSQPLTKKVNESLDAISENTNIMIDKLDSKHRGYVSVTNPSTGKSERNYRWKWRTLIDMNSLYWRDMSINSKELTGDEKDIWSNSTLRNPLKNLVNGGHLGTGMRIPCKTNYIVYMLRKNQPSLDNLLSDSTNSNKKLFLTDKLYSSTKECDEAIRNLPKDDARIITVNEFKSDNFRYKLNETNWHIYHVEWTVDRKTREEYWDTQNLFPIQTLITHQAFTDNESNDAETTKFSTRGDPTTIVKIHYSDGGNFTMINLSHAGSRMLPNNTIGFTQAVQNAISKQDGIPFEWKLGIHDYIADKCSEIVDASSFKKIINYIFDNPNDANSKTILQFMADVYDNLKTILPLLMTYRYYDELKDIKNDGKEVSDYENEEANIVVKPLPILDMEQLYDVFDHSFGKGNFNNSTQFQYKYCVVDLNPNSTEYNNLPSGKFPMQFVNDIDDVNINEYKTSKMVLSRMYDICGGGVYDKNTNSTNGEVIFKMGSSTSDYNKIVDKLKLLYKDDEAIVTGSVNDNATIKLMNGGSYQKNEPFYGIDTTKDGKIDVYTGDTVPLKDNVWLPNGFNSEPIKKMRSTTEEYKQPKYFRNKHLFVDPFAMTIAQWCFAHGWTTKASARNNIGKTWLNGQKGSSESQELKEMESSYWEYINIYEPADWESIFTQYKDRVTSASYDDVDKFKPELIKYLIDNKVYDPCSDTRPYYYASYNDVRGTTQIFKPVHNNKTNYTFGTNDEYQLVSRMADNATPISLLDILNSKVCYNTTPRIYVDSNEDGGRYCDKYNMYKTLYDEKRKLTDEEKKTWSPQRWCSGEIGGINFDLPTEAQWEYCCRLAQVGTTKPTTTSIAPIYDLGDVYETRDANLDMYAWYKYKVIGSLPEPERYCAWRISKMIFGISRDKEKVNNVYEPTDW